MTPHVVWKHGLLMNLCHWLCVSQDTVLFSSSSQEQHPAVQDLVPRSYHYYLVLPREAILQHAIPQQVIQLEVVRVVRCSGYPGRHEPSPPPHQVIKVLM